MNRRAFAGTLGGAGFGPNAPARYFAADRFLLRNGSQLPRLHDYLGRFLLPAIEGARAGRALVLEAFAAPHMPELMVIQPLASLDQLHSLQDGVRTAALESAFDELDSHPDGPFEQLDASLLEAAPYSPAADFGSLTPWPGVVERRVYHSPSWRSLLALHERFAGPEIAIFHRCGIRPFFYASTRLGADLPNLTYLIPFDNLAAREHAWTVFAHDEEWKRVREESVRAHGQVNARMSISLYKPAPYCRARNAAG